MNQIAAFRRSLFRLGFARLCAAVAGVAVAIGAANAEPAPEPTAPRGDKTVDLSPLFEVQTDLSRGLALAFPDYQRIVIGGVQQSNGRARGEGIVDLVSESYDTELDTANRWVVDVHITMFDTSARAAKAIDADCYSFARSAPGGVRWQEGDYCLSPVVRMQTDPRTHLPANAYVSWVMARRDRVVVRLYENHRGSSESAKNRIIREIADRLAKLEPASATAP
jgi:hypothetical protein